MGQPRVAVPLPATVLLDEVPQPILPPMEICARGAEQAWHRTRRLGSRLPLADRDLGALPIQAIVLAEALVGVVFVAVGIAPVVVPVVRVAAVAPRAVLARLEMRVSLLGAPSLVPVSLLDAT